MSLLLLFRQSAAPALSLTQTSVDDSADAFGAPSVSLSVNATSVDDSLDAFGTPVVRLSVTATALVNTQAFGGPTVTADRLRQAAFFAVF